MVQIKKIALFIIYNHRYDKNIPLLERIYKDRFSHVYHIIPFYDGKVDNVIPVYDSSYQFQGYIAQAYQHIKNQGFSHVFVVADDCVINPRINENNLHEVTGLQTDACYIYDIHDFSQTHFWYHAKKIYNWTPKQKGLEIENIIPSYDKARDIFTKNNLSSDTIKKSSIYLPSELKAKESLGYRIKNKVKRILGRTTYVEPDSYKLNYPLAYGYSDILVLTDDILFTFCQYCGAFAAARLFVESAIPTALVLSKAKIQTIGDLKTNMAYKETTPGYQELVERCDYNYDKLVDNYPSDCFHLHPVKLSKWMKR